MIKKSIGDRIIEERKRLGMKQADLADILGVTPVTARSYEKGDSAIPSDKLEILHDNDYDITYIVTGISGAGAGRTKNNDRENNNLDFKPGAPRQFGAGKTPNFDDLGLDTYALIPLYDVEVSAGHGRFACEENIRTHLAFTRYSLQKRGLEPKQLACVNGKGDSMTPSIAPDDTIMIDMSQRNADGGIFVFRHGESYFVKRLILEANAIRVISDNPIYPPWMIEAGDDFEILGKKVWQASWR